MSNPQRKQRPTIGEQGRSSPSGGVKLSDKMRFFIMFCCLFLGGVNFLYISGLYDWIFRNDTVDVVVQTLSITLCLVPFIPLYLIDD